MGGVAAQLALEVNRWVATNPDIRPVGIAINTQALDEAAAKALLAQLGAEHGLPATDPVRFGVDTLIDRLLAEFPASAPKA